MENQAFHFSPFLPVFVNLIRYFIFAGAAFLIVYKLFFNQFHKNKIQSRFAQNKDFLREIKNSFLSTIIFGLVGFGFIALLGKYSQIYRTITDFPFWWLPVSGLLMLVVQDTYFYWVHRAIHSPQLFKYIHRIHHQSTNPSPWASYSFHISEAIIEALIFPIMLFVIPLHPIVIFSFTFVAFLFNVYGHLGFEITPKWFRNSWLFEIMNTSVHHNLHHAKFKGNYGLYFRVWDRIMNTENPNYVKEFDRIQENRFGKQEQTTRILSENSLKKVAFYALMFFVLSSVFAFTQKKNVSLQLQRKSIMKNIKSNFNTTHEATIEGKWKDPKSNAIVWIQRKEDKFFGKVISSGNQLEDQKLEGKTLYILKEFEQKNETEFCCGTLFLPRRKMTVTGTLTLIDDTKLEVKGSYGIFSHQMIWEKISS